MGREVRRVPAGWEHPKRGGRYQPMFDESHDEAVTRYEADGADWENDPNSERYTFEEYYGEPPDPDYYRPSWPEESRTHLMMYETTSEGTPISPAFKKPESLARWLVDAGASAFAGMTAEYEHWLRVCNGGFAPSGVATVTTTGTTMVSGVEGFTPAPTTGETRGRHVMADDGSILVDLDGKPREDETR